MNRKNYKNGKVKVSIFWFNQGNLLLLQMFIIW